MGPVVHAEQPLQNRLARPNTNFVPQLDFLRSFAVLLVVFDHTCFALNIAAFRGIQLGYVGVCGVFLFFVHTSLVLLWSLERKPYALDFYIRRIFRVYPLAMAGTLAVVLTHAPLSLGTNPYFLPFPITFRNVVANLLLLFDSLSPGRGFHALLHVEWTLPWEMKMYLLLPALFAFARRVRSLWPLLLFWVLAVQTAHQYAITPLSFAGSIPNFLAGVIAFTAYKRYEPRLSPWLFPPFLVAFVTALVVLPTLKVCWPFTLLLGLTLPLFRSFSPSVFTRVCQRVAQYSYGIYLVHPFGLWIGFGLMAQRSLVVQLSVAATVTAALCIASYHLLEKPMMNLGSRFAAYVELRMLSRPQPLDASL